MANSATQYGFRRRQRGMVAPFVLEGAINGAMFLAYVKQCVVPILAI
jgi:hypothetical protein